MITIIFDNFSRLKTNLKKVDKYLPRAPVMDLIESFKKELNFDLLPHFGEELVKQNIQFWLWSKDKNGKYLSCNTHFYQGAGFSKEAELLGLTDLDLCWETHGVIFKKNDAQVMQERKLNIFLEITKIISGEELLFYSYKAPLFGHTKKMLGTMGIGFSLNIQHIIRMMSKHDEFHSVCEALPPNHHLLKDLSLREKHCLNYLLKGKTAKETAKLLRISPRTVEEYLTRLRQKLGCRYKRELIALFPNNNIFSEVNDG